MENEKKSIPGCYFTLAEDISGICQALAEGKGDVEEMGAGKDQRAENGANLIVRIAPDRRWKNFHQVLELELERVRTLKQSLETLRSFPGLSWNKAGKMSFEKRLAENIKPTGHKRP